MIVYRKQGSVARWENGASIRVTESGVAIEDGDYFECHPYPGPLSPSGGDRTRVTGVARSLQHLPIERLIILHGVAHHECEGRTWREETDRIHVSLVHHNLRVLVDTTTPRLDEIHTIASALQRADPTERDAPDHLRLEPSVAAALLPQLVGRTPPNVRLVQTAGGVDGYGNEIVEASRDWPNAYRPSYRVRPVRIPLNLRLECDDDEIDGDAPRAIALLAPVSSLSVRVLVVDGQRVHPATVTVDRIRAVAAERSWYPYGGGSFGAAMML